MRVIGPDFGKIEALAALPNRAMRGTERSQMAQQGSSRRSEANCNGNSVRQSLRESGLFLPPTGDTCFRDTRFRYRSGFPRKRGPMDHALVRFGSSNTARVSAGQMCFAGARIALRASRNVLSKLALRSPRPTGIFPQAIGALQCLLQ